jgi:putative ABC transport system substrate-binding protein
MRRREFIVGLGGTMAGWPLLARAQNSPSRIARIVWLSASSSTALDPRNLEQFRLGLAENGLAEGSDLVIEYLWAEGSSDRLRELAADLAKRERDLILTAGAQPVAALLATKSKTPIVFAIYGDPVGDGIVDSLARPGGIATGLSMANTHLESKRLEILKDAIPSLNRVMVLHDATKNDSGLADVRKGARAAGVELLTLEISDLNKIDADFSIAVNKGVNGLVTLASAFLNFHRERLIALANRNRVPSIWEANVFVKDGGLLSYGPNFPDMYRRSAGYVSKILRGAKPTDLPVEQPTKFELAVNLKTAKALGLTVPPTLLARADEVIE